MWSYLFVYNIMFKLRWEGIIKGFNGIKENRSWIIIRLVFICILGYL